MTGPLHGTLTLNGDGSYTYVPALGYTGTDSFTYFAADALFHSTDPNAAQADASAFGTVTFFINATANSPVASDDSATAQENQPFLSEFPGVLSNDFSPQGLPMTASLVANATHGSVSLDPDGTYVYFPSPNYTGSDSFTYVAVDSNGYSSPVATVHLVVMPVDQPPTASDVSFSTNEDAPLNVAGPGLLAFATDPDTAVSDLRAFVVNNPSHGSVTLNPDGSFSYQPDPLFQGTDSFSYRVFDGTLYSDVATAFVSVNFVDHAPTARDDAYVSSEDSSLSIPAGSGVLANDSDPDNNQFAEGVQTLSTILVDQPLHGTVFLNSDGSFDYFPNDPLYHGLDSFSYRATDGTLSSNLATVTIAINSVDHAPIALPDSFTTNEDAPLVVASPGVLGNDFDPDNTPDAPDAQTLSAFLVDGPRHGTVSLNSDGSFTYIPDAHYYGPDRFTYQVSDGQTLSDVTIANLFVNFVPTAPTASPIAFTGVEDSTMTVLAPGVLLTDSNPDGDLPTIVVDDAPQHGELVLFPDGSFTYAPAANYNGPDSFTYHLVSASGLTSAPATVSLSLMAVPDAPVGTPDSYSTNEGSPITVGAGGVLVNDVNVDGDTLRAELVSAPAHGTVSLNPDGTFTYTPAAYFHGTDTFSYVPVNTTLSGSPTVVSLTVNFVPTAPTAAPDSFSTNEDSSLTVSAPGILVNDAFPDGPPTISVDNGPAHGVLNLSDDGSFTYVPAANYNGPDSFTYHLANDSGMTSASVTVSLTVVPVPDAPIGTPDSYSTTEGSPITVGAGGVLVNDVNVDGDALHAELVAAPTHGTVVLNADGSFTYTPAAHYNGPDSFTYVPVNTSLSGSPTVVNLTVSPVPTAPTAAPDSFTTNEDSPLTVSAPGILVNDAFPDGPPTISVDNGPAHGVLNLSDDGSFTYVPAANYNGPDSFTYHLANDSGMTSTSVTVSLTVVPVADAPVAVDDSYSTNENASLTVNASGVLTNDVNVDGDTLHAELVSAPAHGTVSLNSDGTFTYTPAAYFHGTDTFTYNAVNTSKRGVLPATVTITVNPVPVPPTAVNDAFTLKEDQTLTIAGPGILLNDANPDGGTPTITVVNGTQDGTLTVSPSGGITYVPSANFNGSDSFTYYLTNLAGQNSGTATVSLTITPVPDAPVAVADAFTTNEGSPLVVSHNGVLRNDTNVDGDALHAELADAPSHGSVALNADGTFTYTPDLHFFGTDSFTYNAVNTSLSSVSPATVTITVRPVPTAPTAADDHFSLLEDQTLSVPAPGLLLNDTNPDGGTPKITIDNAPLHGGLSANADGSFTYVPMPNYNGPDSFQYHLTSAAGLTSAPATVSLTVVSVADAPVAINDAYSTNENSPLVVSESGVFQNDVNVDGDTLHAQLVDAPSHGSVSLNADGTFSYTPAPNFHGTDSFTYLAVNTSLASASPATVTITVRPVNQAPVAIADAFNTDENRTLTIPAPGILGNDSDAEGPDITAVLINTTQHGTLSLHPDGSFVYVPGAGFSGVDTFTYRASDGQLSSPPTTVTINVGAIAATTVALDPASDTGVSSTDRITNDKTPTFLGTTAAGVTVKLFAQPLGSTAAPTLVGTTTADDYGNYRVTSNPLADGQYAFVVATFRPDGLPTGASIAGGTLMIDTVAPTLQSTSSTRRPARSTWSSATGPPGCPRRAWAP